DPPCSAAAPTRRVAAAPRRKTGGGLRLDARLRISPRVSRSFIHSQLNRGSLSQSPMVSEALDEEEGERGEGEGDRDLGPPPGRAGARRDPLPPQLQRGARGDVGLALVEDRGGEEDLAPADARAVDADLVGREERASGRGVDRDLDLVPRRRLDRRRR